MRTHTSNIQIINDPQGLPAFVVIPYAEYQAMETLKELNTDTYIPNEVVALALDNDWSALRAWREHLGLTQSEVAQRLGITQPTYSQQENAEILSAKTQKKIAAALGIQPTQLDF